MSAPSRHPTPKFAGLFRGFSLPIEMARLQMLLAIAAYKALADYSYITCISPENQINRMTNAFTWEKWAETWIIVMFSALFLPTRIRKPSDFLLLLFFFIPYASHIAMFNFLDGSRSYAYFSVLSFILVALTRNIRIVQPHLQIRDGRRTALAISAALVLFMLATYYLLVGHDTFELNLLEVESNRAAVKELTLQSNFLLGYVGNWVYAVFNMLILAWAIQGRRHIFVILSIVAQIYFFGATQQKAVVFYPILMFASYFLIGGRRPPLWMALGMCLIVFIGLLEVIILDSHFWNLLVNRVVWDAARIDWGYFNFFSEHGLVYMSDSVTSAIIHYPYQLPPQYMAGLHLYGNPLSNADTGILGASFMEFGFTGMVFYGLITGFLMWTADALTLNRVPVWIGAGLTLSPFYTLFNDSDLPTTLLSHGMALSFVVLLLYGQFTKYGKTFSSGSREPVSA